MNILVVDVAASESGALSILNLYYKKLMKDSSNNYFFCVSIPELDSKKNITVLPFKWVKTSWLHRLWFDHVTCRKIIKKYNIEKIISLQNTAVSHTNLPQIIYIHQSLPFVDYRFSFLENRLFWIYQNIIGKMIIKSAQKAAHIIVQTNWMKDSVIQRAGIEEDKVEVCAPEFEIDVKEFFSEEEYHNDFFYPATGMQYKNHKVILQAIHLLKKQNITNFQVAFTLQKEELSLDCIALLDGISENVLFLGRLSRDDVIRRYSRSVLIFPSFIETFGLPLLEAQFCETPIIASDLPFSREVLDNYHNVEFFPWDNAKVLASKIKMWIK